MSEPTTSPNPKSPEEATQEEVRRLRSQVRRLEAELGRRPGRTRRAAADVDRDDVNDESDREASGDTERTIRDVPSRAVDEVARVVRGLTFATLEPVRALGDVLNIFTDEVFRRNTPERHADRRREGDEREDRPTPTTLVRDLPGDLYSGFVAAFDEALTIPRRTIDTLTEKYRESEDADATRPGDEARRERRRAETLERQSGRLRRAAEQSHERASRLEREAGRERPDDPARTASERGKDV